MRPSRPGVIVPVRDRRQHRRILTLKNFRNAMIVVVVLVAGITIEANLRHSSGRADFGRLYGRRMPDATAAPRQPEVITEAPVPEASAADPMLVAAAAREELLRAESNVPTATVTPEPTAPAAAAAPAGSKVAIVGGPEGVSLVRQPAARPLLGGGFGRD